MRIRLADSRKLFPRPPVDRFGELLRDMVMGGVRHAHPGPIRPEPDLPGGRGIG